MSRPLLKMRNIGGHQAKVETLRTKNKDIEPVVTTAWSLVEKTRQMPEDLNK
jgi:hypothetical protein